MTKPVVKVQKKLWEKLTEVQRKEWNEIYVTFLEELNTLSEINNRTKAFNLAFLVVWKG